MIITKVFIENGGKHKRREFNCNASVVGLVGPNGCGKSTFLQLLEYGLNGLLSNGTAESYIRYGTKKMTVGLEFFKNGEVGKITRKVTPTTATRELIWQGKTYTKAAEVDAIMSDLLGADRQAVSNAVFQEQGSLDKLLFEGQSQREATFTKMLNVSFLEKTCGIIDARVKQLSSGIEDLSVVFDELCSQVRVAETDMVRLNGECSALPDNSARVVLLREVLNLLEVDQIYRNKLDTANTQQAIARRELGEYLRLGGYASLADVELMTAQLETARDALIAQSMQLRETAEYKKQWEKITTETLDLTTRRQTGYKLLADENSKVLPPSLELSVRISKLNARASLEGQLTAAKDSLEHAIAGMLAHSITTRPEGDVASLRDQERALIEKRAGVSQETAVLAAVLNVTKAARCDCPVCHQAVKPELIDPSRLEALNIQDKSISAELQKVTADRMTLERTQSEWDNATNRYTEQIVSANGQIAKLEADLSAIAVEGTLAEVQALFKQAAEHEQNLKIYSERLAEIDGLLQRLDNEKTKLAPRQLQIEAYKESDLIATTAALEENQNARTRLAALKSGIGQRGDSVSKLEGECRGYDAVLIETNGKLSKLVSVGTAVPPVDSIRLEKADLEAKETQRHEAAGRARQAREQYNAIRDKLTALEARRAKNESRQQTVADLARVREVLSRGNLPMTYVTYQFQRLTILTQQVLNEMGAPFVIELDPDTPVSFRFTRLDDPEAQPLDMSKLSGGQKVRLSIAFLVAVQRLIIPEVGLLILDEPSTHLDAQAVDSLKDLLMSMSTILQNTNSQVWVVDHNPALQAALGASINLEN